MIKKVFFFLMLAGLFATALYFLRTPEIVKAHGSMNDPISRIYACYLENPETPDSLACLEAIRAGGTQAIYDWNEINQPNAGGDHQAVIPDGTLCSGGREKYAFFDNPRTDWAITRIPQSGMYTFIYEAYVPHNQGYFEFYVTKNEYDFSAPLKWSDLEYPAFARVEEPPVIGGAYVMDVNLPEGKNGRHVIYVIWQRDDSQEAFYSCSDVWFGNDPMPEPTEPPACEYPDWDPSVIYNEDDWVSHNESIWRAKWGTGGTEPSTAGTSNPWEYNGDCSETGPEPTETPSPEPGIKGDSNDDGKIDIIDALLIAQFYVGTINEDFTEELADFDCSGKIDIVDALLIAQYYVGAGSTIC